MDNLNVLINHSSAVSPTDREDPSDAMGPGDRSCHRFRGDLRKSTLRAERSRASEAWVLRWSRRTKDWTAVLYNTSVGDSGGLEGEDVADDPDNGREGLFDGGVEVMLEGKGKKKG